uniref:NADH-ubiquinone oxidoreductase chain 4L n=2 Tax=Lucanus TaxID=41108 RepID=A0A650BYF5_LUCCE|nr:NADH dehydrogenase subunit 4L [Lucanus cervus]APO08640.1 NADH dehydrogenase subunit 4L [Lucanus sp. BMNH 1425267]QDW75839.1 NADH dehydrogenase subunit 4L [Lucanus cervus]QGQ62206.1 NADH dehydrogenase subunit 4l [Lucanus cervus]UIN24727.1 NADH dehydrogenase subunit 4L [Lucanus cervus]
MLMVSAIFIFMYFAGLLSFCMNRKHMLLMLLSLEFIVISLFFGLFMFLGFYSWEYYFVLIFLTISVCEGALGLALMVMLMRVHGNDYTQSFNLLW